METNKTAATEPHTIEVADGGTGLWPIVVKDACGDPIARFSYGSDAKKFAAHDDLVKALYELLHNTYAPVGQDTTRLKEKHKEAVLFACEMYTKATGVEP